MSPSYRNQPLEPLPPPSASSPSPTSKWRVSQTWTHNDERNQRAATVFVFSSLLRGKDTKSICIQFSSHKKRHVIQGVCASVCVCACGLTVESKRPPWSRSSSSSCSRCRPAGGARSRRGRRRRRSPRPGRTTRTAPSAQHHLQDRRPSYRWMEEKGCEWKWISCNLFCCFSKSSLSKHQVLCTTKSPSAKLPWPLM